MQLRVNGTTLSCETLGSGTPDAHLPVQRTAFSDW